MSAAPLHIAPEPVVTEPPVRRALPAQGVAHEELLASMHAFRAKDADWHGGRCFSLVYHASDEHTAFLKQAHNLFFEENGLNPMAFKSLKRMEAEVVRMACTLFHGDAQTCGTMTSGGTESLLLAVKTARDRFRAMHPLHVGPLEVVLPTTAHVAFDKAGHYFGVKLKHVPVGADHRANVKAMARAISRNTILLVGSAPQYPHGVVDPIEELGALALEHGLPLHVDACVGGFILPFLEKLGRSVPTWDFRVPGVTSISADLHKYGYTAKGASLIVYRSMDHLKHQFFVATEFPGGVYASPSLPGTRPGGSIAAAWAGVLAMGEEGYLALARRACDASDRIRAGLAHVDGVELMGAPHSTIVTWRTTEKSVNVYAVADQLEDRGWHVDRQHKPACIHLTVTANHQGIVDEYVADVRAAIEHVRAHPELKSRGNAAMYGMMAKVPMRMMVKGAVQKVMEQMYGPASLDGDVDIKKPQEGFVGKLMEKYGERAMNLIDKLDDLRGRK
jgi:sphinganine-1-phosphate aldolase